MHRSTLVPFVAGLFAVLLAAFIVASLIEAGPVAAGTGANTAGTGVTGAIGTSGLTGTDDVRAQEWWLSELSAPQAWGISKGTGVTVAVLSTGVSPSQADLADDVITGPDYTESGRFLGGPYWGIIGTAVASVIAGHGHGAGDDSGIIGIAPAAKILSVRVNLEYNDPLNATTAITQRLPGAIADGIVYAANHGAKVIDLPLDPGTFGLAGDSAAAGGGEAEQAAVRYALAKGAVLVAPSGDNGVNLDQVNYPAAYPGVIAVGAVGRDGRTASFTSEHSYVTLSAPGVDLTTATMLPDGAAGYVPGYAPISTTAVSSGMVAGVAALIVSRYPDLTPSQVTRALHEGATGAASTVNALRAVHAAALLTGATSVKPPVTKPVKPRPVTRPAPVRHQAAPRPAATTSGSGALASRVLRDAVFGAVALILLLVGLVLMTWSLRRRTRTPHGHGVREQRRGRAGETADAPADGAVRSSLRRVTGPGSPVTAGRPMASASDWHAPASWDAPADHSAAWPAEGFQGRGLGEVAHPAARPQRPIIEPLPKKATADRASASPPWAPAADPGSGSVPGQYGGPDLTAPFAGRDVLTQASLGFAAAPVRGDYPMPASPPAETDEEDPD
jgi:hypothetical protein